MIYIYSFEDGTTLTLLNVPLTVAEVWKLEELHGKCKKMQEYKRRNNETNIL
jgi:hypothetical protein